MSDSTYSNASAPHTHAMPSMEGGARRTANKGSLFYYTVTKSSIGKSGGRYSSKSGPGAAAKKAASKRFGKASTGKMRLTVRENGTDHEFTYDATRSKLAKPVVRKIGGVTITSEYQVDVKAVKP